MIKIRNIQKGKVSVYINGIPQEASVKMDSYVIVTLPDVNLRSVYTVEVESIEDERFFQKRIVDALARVECGNVHTGHCPMYNYKFI